MKKIKITNKKNYKKFYVKIEISANSYPVKYEIKKKKLLYVDRFIPTSMYYPCNYGYIQNTISLDKDPLDALVMTPYPLIPMSIIKCRAIGLLEMEDDDGLDNKIFCLPHKNLLTEYNKINEISDISSIFLKKILHFFKYYKNLEHKKWTKIKKWKNKKKAQQEIKNSFKRYENLLKKKDKK